VINGNFAESAGLSPTKDGIAVEASKGPYVNVIAVRAEDKDKPWVAKLIKAYHSPEIKKFVIEKYKNSVITSW